jgi:hypothetical protein
LWFSTNVVRIIKPKINGIKVAGSENDEKKLEKIFGGMS